jgi:phosphoglycolate phosphatase-like HAD superfamily hydrolase
MKKPNITEGEWHATGLEIRSLSSMILANIYNHLEVNQSKEEAKANAKAISAVPEMIDALCSVYLDYQLESVSYSTHNALVKVLTALKKAGVEL